MHEGKRHEANEPKNVARVKCLHAMLISAQLLLTIQASTKCRCSQLQLVTLQPCQENPTAFGTSIDRNRVECSSPTFGVYGKEGGVDPWGGGGGRGEGGGERGRQGLQLTEYQRRRM